MAYFLDRLEPFKEEALQLFEKGTRPYITLFSKSIYQLSFEPGEHKKNKKNHFHQEANDEPIAHIWTFVQLDNHGEVADIFCSCCRSPSSKDITHDTHDEAKTQESCLHMALSFLYLFSGGDLRPLHSRFEQSSFHSVFKYLGIRLLQKIPHTSIKPTFHYGTHNSYCQLTYDESNNIVSTTQIIVIRADKKKIEQLETVCTISQHDDNDECSMKFASLSESELQEWQESGSGSGHSAVDPNIKYKLSSLFEIAKWLFLICPHPFEISIDSYSTAHNVQICEMPQLFLENIHQSGYPTQCRWIWPNGIECCVYGLQMPEACALLDIAAEQRLLLRPVPDVISEETIDVATVRVQKSTQNNRKKTVELFYSKTRVKNKREALLTEQLSKNNMTFWKYCAHDNIFYKVIHDIASHHISDPVRIESILNYLFEISPFECFHICPFLEQVYVDAKNSKITCHAMHNVGRKKSTKDKEYTYIANIPYRFGKWAYREEDIKTPQQKLIRFYSVSSFPFPKSQIYGPNIAHFISQHTLWLTNQSDLYAHFPSQSHAVFYKIDKKTHAVSFHRKERPRPTSVFANKKGDIRAFNRVIWKKNKGLVHKKEALISLDWKEQRAAPTTALPFHTSSVPFDVPIPPYKVAAIIKNNEGFLKGVPGFFAPYNPIMSTGLQILYESEPKRVAVHVQHEWKDKKYVRNSIIYDEYGYVFGLGFFVLPTLPIQNIETTYISAKNRQQAWRDFFLIQLPKYREEFQCHVDTQLIFPKKLQLYCNRLRPQQIDIATISYMIRSSCNWEADFFWESEYGVVTIQELLHYRQTFSRFIPTQAGCIDIEESRFLWIEMLFSQQTSSQSKNTQVSKKQYVDIEHVHSHTVLPPLKIYDILRINAYDAFKYVEKDNSDKKVFQRYPLQQVIKKLLDNTSLRSFNLKYLKSDLRPYQRTGLDWLWFLYTTGLCGLLCDDMGVGKTHQAMALLAAVYADKELIEQQRGHNVHISHHNSARFLVVCPTSLIWHWKEKLSCFLPEVIVCCYFGSERSKAASPEEFSWNIFLTSYGIWKNEVALLKRMHFDVAIFDELQVAKNHRSLIWAALAQVQATMRLGLTGTPIENQLRELKALFDLILPGYFPTNHLFRDNFIRPIEKDGDKIKESSNERKAFEKRAFERRALLARSIEPFVLRRRKEEVLPELPAKIEEIIYTELSKDQKHFYNQITSLQGTILIHQLQDESQRIPYMNIFALIANLKRLCNHPACYLNDAKKYKKYESGKWNVFQEIITQAQHSGQKVVVFSHYLIMLDIIKTYLDEIHVGYTEIRGKTRHRENALQQFKDDPHTRVFLGSLHAAGLGIDLTAASVVVHYDRWWNAARENQATDRVHRIGQSRGVQVIKMITKGTIEEHINLMIHQKSHLLEDVIAYDDHHIIKKMTRYELIHLIEKIQLFDSS